MAWPVLPVSFVRGACVKVSFRFWFFFYFVLFSVLFDGRIWFIVVFGKSFSFWKWWRGEKEERDKFLLFYISFSVLVEVPLFKRMLFFLLLRVLRYSKIFLLLLLLFFFLFNFFFILFSVCVISVRHNLMMFRLTYFVFKLSVNPEIWMEYNGGSDSGDDDNDDSETATAV